MPAYRYTATTLDGGTVQGVIEAERAEEAEELLTKKDLIPLSVTPIKKSFSFLQGQPRLSPRELVRFYRDLGRMVRAGLELLDAFRTLEESVSRPQARELIAKVRRQIEEGVAMSEAMAGVKAFPDAHIAAIKAAEATGKLDEALLQLADSTERTQKLIGEVKGALTYPAMIFGLAIVISYYLLTNMVPKILANLQQVGLKELPTPTKVVVGLSSFLQANALLLMLLLIGLGFAFSLWVRTPEGRKQFDALLLRAPLIGPLIRNLSLVRALQTLAFLLASGVSITEALSIAAAASGNKVLEEVFLKVRQRIELGEPISQAMGAFKATLTPLVVAAAKIGEKAANLSDPFSENASALAEDTREQAQLMAKALEPIMLIFLAIMVGAIILAIFLPMYDLLDQLKARRA